MAIQGQITSSLFYTPASPIRHFECMYRTVPQPQLPAHHAYVEPSFCDKPDKNFINNVRRNVFFCATIVRVLFKAKAMERLGSNI